MLATKLEEVVVMAETGPEPIQGTRAALEQALREVTDGRQPVVGHFGALQVDGRPQAWWSIRFDEAVTRLIANPDYKVAQILSVLGSEVRLSILRTLLDGGRTAAEIVAALSLNTTGQAYHHLKELERARYVYQKNGRYHFDMKGGRLYLTALALAADGGAEDPDEKGE